MCIPLALTRDIDSGSQLLGQPRSQRPCRYAAWLGVPDQPLRTATGLEAEFGQLSRLALAGSPTHHNNGMACERLENFNSMRTDRKSRVVLEPQINLQHSPAYTLDDLEERGPDLPTGTGHGPN